MEPHPTPSASNAESIAAGNPPSPRATAPKKFSLLNTDRRKELYKRAAQIWMGQPTIGLLRAGLRAAEELRVKVAKVEGW